MWRFFFAMAAIFNLGVAGMMLAAPSRFAMHFALTGPGAPYLVGGLAWFMGALGVGYAVVARDIAHNRGVVWAGLLSKIGFALMVAMQFAAEIIPYRYFALGMGDVVLAAGFAIFLWRNRTQR
jgi:hypothetical protein